MQLTRVGTLRHAAALTDTPAGDGTSLLSGHLWADVQVVLWLREAEFRAFLEACKTSNGRRPWLTKSQVRVETGCSQMEAKAGSKEVSMLSGSPLASLLACLAGNDSNNSNRTLLSSNLEQRVSPSHCHHQAPAESC
ncbi:unnamed protein product [Symbiodinium natans]|uniref:Uncharacterized protein n=1 Tax=Symbiodinium natans TaxID=878477 RepID=A0A812SKJ2_9DINO|nr:unnamed protein product [Symbiodinium natans]